MRSRLLRTALLFVGLCASAAPLRGQETSSLAALSLAPASVTGGAAATGTVTLSPAPRPSAAVVALSSSNPAVATVPMSATVQPGATTQTFPITTRPVTAETAVTITASLGVTRSATLRVQPGPGSGGSEPQLSVEVGDQVLGRDTGPLGSPRPAAAARLPTDTVLGPSGVPLAGRVGGVHGRSDNGTIRRVTDDGSLFVTDSAGTALLRLRAAIREILLDPTARDPVDGVGLARLLRAEVGLDGASVILALRADNTRGLYRLDKAGLTRLAVFPDDSIVSFGDEELTVGDAGQIAYVALSSSPSRRVALFQAIGEQRVQLLGPDQKVVDTTGSVVLEGTAVGDFGSIQSNGAGDLVFLVAYGQASALPTAAVVRKTGAGLAVLARSGQVVQRGVGAGTTGELGLLAGSQPRIGPDGTVVFRGLGRDFTNFFVARPGRALAPLLPGSNWSYDGEYDIAANGAIALRAVPEAAAPASPNEPAELHLVAPDGSERLVAGGRLQPQSRLQPRGRPVLGPGGQLFFLAGDTGLPPDAEGVPPVGLFRLGKGGAVAVAVPGQEVLGKPGVRLLTIGQPVASATGVAFEAQFGATGASASSQTGFFQVPLSGALTAESLLAGEGAPLPGANRLALLRSLSFRADGRLVFAGLQPGAAPLIAALPAVVAGARPRTQAVQRAVVESLLTVGQPLDRPDRQLQTILSPPIPLGGDRQLVAARYTQAGGPGGQGLFIFDESKQVQAIALTTDPRSSAGAPLAALADAPTPVPSPAIDCFAFSFSPNPRAIGLPSAASSGNLTNVIFKAFLAGTSGFGLFQWTGAAIAPVALDNDHLLPGDPTPYGLERWTAGVPGRGAAPSVFFLARNKQDKARLFERSAAGLRPLIDPDVDTTDLRDFVVTGDGGVFVAYGGQFARVSGIFRVQQGRLQPVAMPGGSIPPFAGGRNDEVRDLSFDVRFGLMPDSARGPLLFRAEVVMGQRYVGRGLFRLGPQGLQTLLIERMGVAGARDLIVDSLADSFDRQTANGTTVFATFSKKDGWTLTRSRVTQDSTGRITVTTTPVLQEGQPLPGGKRIVSLDPSLLLTLPCRSGPLFSLSDQGTVACLASNGERWGIYLFPPGP